MYLFNPLVTNGLSHPYHLDGSTFINRSIRSDFSFLFHFSMKFMKANRIAPDGTLRFAASHLGLFCLPISYKKGRQAYNKHQLIYRQRVHSRKISNLHRNSLRLLRRKTSFTQTYLLPQRLDISDIENTETRCTFIMTVYRLRTIIILVFGLC